MGTALQQLASDFLSAFVFLAVYLLTDNVTLATCVAVAVGVAQFAVMKARGRPIDAMQWLALGLVIVLGAATIVTQDSRFIMVKPTFIHWAIGGVMLRHGWMTRYLPPIARDNLPAGLMVGAGYAWAALMFLLGALNLFVATAMSFQAWTWFITVGAVGAKVVAFLVQYVVFRTAIRRKLVAEAAAGAAGIDRRMTADVGTIVVGAGVVGLAVARALAMAGHEVMVLEQHELIGSETSSRNSEVIHAGIYYPPGSLRATLCVRGKELLYAFCAENRVAHKRCGKLVVATQEAQLPKLAAIKETAARNGVHDLEHLGGNAARALEPELACVAALLSPSTGIVDSHGYMLALEGHIEGHGGRVVLRCPVERIERLGGGDFRLTTGGDNPGGITCCNLVLSAGLHVSKLARTLSYGGGYQPPETYYAKGQYYALSGRSPFQRHIYPMPDGAWLGLHVTVDIGGRCKFGPDIEWIPGLDYSFEPEKLEKFLGFVRSYYPGLEVERLHPDYTGIRPKLYREGEAAPDFAIHGADKHGQAGLVALYGIESPGLTASLAIGEYVARMLGQASA